MELESTTTRNIPNDGAAVRERHGRYYIELVVFEVENTLFRVQKSGFLRSNPNFFDLVRPNDLLAGAEDGSNPIRLGDVTVQAFEGLLLVLYPIEDVTPSYEEWIGALDLSTRCNLTDIRTKAINALSVLNENANSATEVIKLAKKYAIKSWLQKSYVNLIQRQDLKLEDLVGSLDSDTIMRIFATQAYLYRVPDIPWRSCTNCSNGHGFRHCNFCCLNTTQEPCDNCRQEVGYETCAHFCKNPTSTRPKRKALEERGLVEAEVRTVFSAEFLAMPVET
ncbi:hypothetical protein CPB83DRAFT_840231 [Crepidotus variabilis]|uniref:BTB domain-containing protein n=1 Tax=Crepidotus variabilis TaxID=179855 RepID=A0A9P6E5C7_9AGAR|nr:hypothetical protein CPB83DRAFT_840231 [Crepidotus variabilis]